MGINETPEDRDRQSLFFDYIERWSPRLVERGFTGKGLSYAKRLDYMLVSNNDHNLCGWAEIKCTFRTIESLREVYSISLSKVAVGRSYVALTEVPAWLFVWFTKDNKFGYVDLSKVKTSAGFVYWGGWKKRGLPGDMEPMVRIPIDTFAMQECNLDYEHLTDRRNRNARQGYLMSCLKEQ
jgi:hypothetical protein